MKKKENIVIIVALIIMVIAIIGVSYAAFNYSGLGSKVNTITTGAIKMTYTEDDNIISMSGALPTTDKTGKVRLNPGEYFDFTVSSEITGNVNINYEISAKDVTTSDRKIDGSNIKLYLTRLTDDGEEELMTPETYNEESSANNFTGRPAGEMSLYTSSMNSSESNNYRLRMWVDEDYNPQGDGGGLQFSVQVNVYGKDGNPEDIYPTVATKLLSGVGENGALNTDDPEQTFITGTDPNNYIWYSGKLWRAVSIDPNKNSVKLVTEWNISTIAYQEGYNSAFEDSHMEAWLNDTSVDGFLGNLREPDKFIVIDAKWNSTEDNTSLGRITRPSDNGTIVTDAVGLLNVYEYQMSYSGTTYSNGYLNNGLNWWTLTPYNASNVRNIEYNGWNDYFNNASSLYGVRPSINLKPNIKIADGDGTASNPYRLSGDNDTELSGTMLNARYSGEYIKFGTGENNLYRIVSHENGTGTKITSAEPLKNSGIFITSSFGNDSTFSSANTIGTFLNGEYLTNYVGNDYANMIEESTTWYLGTVGYRSSSSYKLAKYTNIIDNNLTSNVMTAKVGLLRYGELMAAQFDRYDDNDYNTEYWTLTPRDSSTVWGIDHEGQGLGYTTSVFSIRIKPSLNLKSNVVITSGDGTQQNPFTIALQ